MDVDVWSSYRIGLPYIFMPLQRELDAMKIDPEAKDDIDDCTYDCVIYTGKSEMEKEAAKIYNSLQGNEKLSDISLEKFPFHLFTTTGHRNFQLW
ncbi:hypothetical protein HK098_000127 [Nowakowskiella sp. JEL0407]|nr:hypothetical protein HK098_000127 [Nowakowskiella sp. JEL0407]